MDKKMLNDWRKYFLWLNIIGYKFALIYIYSVTFWVFNNIYNVFASSKIAQTVSTYSLGQSIQNDWNIFVKVGMGIMLLMIIINFLLGIFHTTRNKHIKSAYFKNVLIWFVLAFLLTMSYSMGALFVDLVVVARAAAAR